MSLAGQDNYPGCWGDSSKDWPFVRLPSEQEAERAFVACSKGGVVPYGSYVKVDLDIRVINDDYKFKLEDYLAKQALESCEMNKDAVLSDCGRYRYRLSRHWKPYSETGKEFLFIGINPSVADADIDDQTVKKWIGFTERNGGGGFHVCNIFAYRSTDSSKLSEAEDPIGADNHWHIDDLITTSDIIVPCWGGQTKVPKALQHQFDVMTDKLAAAKRNGATVLCFGKTVNHDPRHPCMLAYKTKLVPFFEN